MRTDAKENNGKRKQLVRAFTKEIKKSPRLDDRVLKAWLYVSISNYLVQDRHKANDEWANKRGRKEKEQKSS